MRKDTVEDVRYDDAGLADNGDYTVADVSVKLMWHGHYPQQPLCCDVVGLDWYEDLDDNNRGVRHTAFRYAYSNGYPNPDGEGVCFIIKGE